MTDVYEERSNVSSTFSCGGEGEQQSAPDQREGRPISDEDMWRTRISESTTVRLPGEKDVIAESRAVRLSRRDAIAESQTVRLPRGNEADGQSKRVYASSGKDNVAQGKTIRLPDRREAIASRQVEQLVNGGKDGDGKGSDGGDRRGNEDDETISLPLITFSSYMQEQTVHAFDMGLMKTPFAFDMYSAFEEKPSLFDGYHEPHTSEFDTIPMMVLKDISILQGAAAPTMRSEVSGAAGGVY